MKPRSAGYGAPYPPVSTGANATDRGFKQRVPDKQILEHDRRRMVEVKVMEERERLERENESNEMENKLNEVGADKKKMNRKYRKHMDKSTEDDPPKDRLEDPSEDSDPGFDPILTEEEIEERCEALRAKLLKELEEEQSEGGFGTRPGKMLPPRDRRNLKSYQVHELAEAKIEESERLRRALGIKEDRETGEISSGRPARRSRD